MTYIDWIGTLGGIGTTVAFIPQMLKVWKNKETKDISLGMYLIYIFGIIMWLTYGILLNAYPIIIANIFSLIFASVVLIFKLKYK